MKYPIRSIKSIQPAKLPENCDEIDGSEEICAAGWGRIVADIPTNSTTLRHGFLKTQSEEQCAESLALTIWDIASVLCADPIDGQAFGNGDSGTNFDLI